jgi:hypothetical protein
VREEEDEAWEEEEERDDREPCVAFWEVDDEVEWDLVEREGVGR